MNPVYWIYIAIVTVVFVLWAWRAILIGVAVLVGIVLLTVWDPVASLGASWERGRIEAHRSGR